MSLSKIAEVFVKSVTSKVPAIVATIDSKENKMVRRW